MLCAFAVQPLSNRPRPQAPETDQIDQTHQINEIDKIDEIHEMESKLFESALDHLLASRPDDQWLKRMKEIETRMLSIPEDELPGLTPKQLQYIDAFATKKER